MAFRRRDKRSRTETSGQGEQEPPVQPPVNPYETGLNLLTPEQQVLYTELLHRTRGPQKFADVQTLKDLYVYNGVLALF